MRRDSIGGALRHDPEPRTPQRLSSRRLIVAAHEPAAAEAMAEALRASGASVVVLHGPESDLDAALALDADAILVLEPTEPSSVCGPMVEVLRGHPRLRWASVIRVASAALESELTRSFALASIASHVADAAAPGVELAVRAKGKLPHMAQLQPLGMNRMLRVLADTHRTLRVELSGAWGVATLELDEGRLLQARAELAGSQTALSDVHALAALLPLAEAELRIESGGPPARGWNLPATVALARASALVHPGHPQIEWPQPYASVEGLAGPLTDTTGTEVEAPERALDGMESGTRSRVDLAATRETPLLELIAHVEASRVPMPAPQLTASALARFVRSHGRLAAGASLVTFCVALGLAYLVHIDAGPRVGASRTAVHHGPVAVPAAQPQPPEAPEPAATPLPSANIEPAEAAAPPVSAAPATREEQPGRLKEAQLLVQRARRQRRAGKLEHAEATYLEAVARLPNYPLAIAGLVRVYLDRKNGVEAVRWAEPLVKLQPSRDSYQLLLGDAYALRGDAAKAEQAWRQAKQLGSKTARKRLRVL